MSTRTGGTADQIYTWDDEGHLATVTEADTTTDPLVAGLFCLGLGVAIVCDMRNIASHFVAKARDEKAQRVINKVVGWGFIGCGVLFTTVSVIEGFSEMFAD